MIAEGPWSVTVSGPQLVWWVTSYSLTPPFLLEQTLQEDVTLVRKGAKGKGSAHFVKMSMHTKAGCRLGGKSWSSRFSQGQLGRAVLWDSSLDIDR